MGWFERYGIPGTYFVAVMAGWTWALHPQIMPWSELDDVLAPTVAVLVAVSFPIGYVISIIGQSLYLNWRRCLWPCPCLRGWLGVHGAALDKARRECPIHVADIPPFDEAVIEAVSAFRAVSAQCSLGVGGHQYLRDWMRRRMDVMAIDLSLIVATVLAGLLAVVIYSFRKPTLNLLQWPPSPSGTLFAASIIVIAAMTWNITKHRRALIEMIARVYCYCSYQYGGSPRH